MTLRPSPSRQAPVARSVGASSVALGSTYFLPEPSIFAWFLNCGFLLSLVDLLSSFRRSN
jgi:hypothetical protein